MFYHNITKDDMLNGEGLRVVLWVSGCSHNCKGCHNPQTHDSSGGILFDDKAEQELFEQLDKDYISGLTLSGGDPFHEDNIEAISELTKKVKSKYGEEKTIWLYSGYKLEEIISEDIHIESNISSYQKYMRRRILLNCDVFVDGRFVEELKDEKYHWAGSTNQRVIDVKKTIEKKEIVLYGK